MPNLLLGEPLLVLAGEMDTTRVEGKSMRPVKSCMGSRPWHEQGTWIYGQRHRHGFCLLAGERSVSENWVMEHVGKGMGVRD